MRAHAQEERGARSNPELAPQVRLFAASWYSLTWRDCCTKRWRLIWLARGRVWKDVAVPKPYPFEFRDDVVRVARNREPGVTIEQIANDFAATP